MILYKRRSLLDETHSKITLVKNQSSFISHSSETSKQAFKTIMANFLVFAATLALAVVLSEACTSSSGRTPSWDVGNSGAEVYPTYDPNSGAVGVGVTIPFKRAIDGGKLQVFNVIDVSGDGYIDACEWSTEHGSVKNFVEFLTDDDDDGDERISWEEFQKVSV